MAKTTIEVKIVMDEYGDLFVILPNGDTRRIVADVYGNPYYGTVRVGETVEEKNE